jgi:hypothetical protein
MMIQDSSGTVLVIAENRGKNRLAGLMDVTGDLARFCMYAFSGVLLMTAHGWLGRLFILPILATGYLTTNYATKWATEHIADHTNETQNAEITQLKAEVAELRSLLLDK